MLKWHDKTGLKDQTPAKSCNINQGVLDNFGSLIPLLYSFETCDWIVNCIPFACSGASAPHGSLGTWTNHLLHDSIKPIKHADKVTHINLTALNKLSLQEFKSIEAAAFLHNTPGIADNINKDRILTKYTDSCRICGIQAQVATIQKVRPSKTNINIHGTINLLRNAQCARAAISNTEWLASG